ncbi:MAG TPA: polymer-forming cytoskeletal protein [Natrialbaceae archaeon]|nr:polymer-forming cytoskeletal protein [Natrialbaceae archaeon]
MNSPRFFRRGSVFLIVLLLVLASMPGIVAADRTEAGGTIVVEADETVRGDLTAMGGTVVIRGTVTGDVQAFAGSVDIDGTVRGNVEGAAGSINVGRSGVIGGNLEAGAGSVTIDGTVRGDVKVGAETITLGPTAVVEGDVRYDGKLQRANGATVAGTVTRDDSIGGISFVPSIPSWTVDVYGFVVNLVFAAALLLVFPRFTDGMGGRTIASPGRTAAAGLIALIGIPILLVAIAITIIGIPITIMGIFAYALMVWVAYVLGRYVVGVWILSYTDFEGRWVALLVGFVVIGLLGLVPLVGWVFDLAALLLGLGALVLGFRQMYRARREPEAPIEAEGERGDRSDDTEPQPGA